MPILDLAALPWTLTGWIPHNWEMGMTMETGIPSRPETGPLPMRVPGSVQQAVLDAGIIPDWRDGLQSRAGEWIENRHWVCETAIPAGTLAGPGPHQLLLHGVDGSCAVLVGKRIVARLANTFRPHRIDLPVTAEALIVRLAFTDQPRALGQVHRTSTISDWKSRYPYVWDWTPRVAQIGPWEGVAVISGPSLRDLRATTALTGADGTVTAWWDAADLPAGAQVRLELHDEAEVVLASETFDAATGSGGLLARGVQTWWPNGHGAQPVYRLVATLLASGTTIDRYERQVGFRNVTWQPCRGAPAGSRDWICTVNGTPVFLQGANWVPLRTCFADVRPEEYRARLATYRELGFNLLRVWGGSVLERELFYDLCDELGLMVWQEFPLSSSGIDNHPPADPGLVEDMRGIAAHYVAARQHHPSLIVWCGGNELQRAADGGPGIGRPCDEREPMLAAQAAVCAQLDPERRYVPASASGPRFMADEKEFGQGLHHDVHGPWGHSGDLATWRSYWDRDDALIRTEVGFPGAQSESLTRRHGGLLAWPANHDNPYWLHTANWWVQWDDFRRERPQGSTLSEYVAWSQQRQAEALAYAAAASKRRFPACAGFIVWMGHDCFPCPGNTSVIDVEGNPKPAGLALAEAFR